MVLYWHLVKKQMKQELKIGFLAGEMHMQPRVCIRRHEVGVCRLETMYIWT